MSKKIIINKKMNRTENLLVNLLKEFTKKRQDGFSGLGLIIYDSRIVSNIPATPLRPSFNCPSNIFIKNKKKTIEFLLEISHHSHIFHDGFHFFNENGKLTHVSQYLSPPLLPEIIPNELHGSRYLTALCTSSIKGIMATGIVSQDYAMFCFKNGRIRNLTTQWEDIFKKGEKKYEYYKLTEPHEDMKKIKKIFKNKKVKKILDLGCGVGGNLFYLAKERFEVYGIDLAKEGIKIIKKNIKKKNTKIKLKIGNVFESLPYPNNFFDAVISVQVLQHGSFNQIKKAITEIERVLKPKGLIFITLCGRYSQNKLRYCLVKTAKRIAPRTYVPTIGNEAGLIHYIYNEQVLREHYKNFKILSLWKDSKDYYCFLGENRKIEP